MPYIKDSFSILAECAAIDLPDTRRVVRESEVRNEYENIEEATVNYTATAEMVPVVQIENEYFTEAQFMAPFMRDAGIKSMTEALDCIAEANNLSKKSVGLLVESNCSINAMIEKACQKESAKAKDAVMNKIGKATDLVKDLKSKGYPVKRKPNKIREQNENKDIDWSKTYQNLKSKRMGLSDDEEVTKDNLFKNKDKTIELD